MRLALTVLTAAAILAPGLAHANPAVGDTLACQSRHKGRQLYAVVGRITPYGQNGAVASVSLVDTAAGRAPQGDHIPVDLRMLNASCPVKSLKALPLGAHFEDGYTEWRLAFDAGEAGVFALSIDEIDDILQAQRAKPTTKEARR